MAKRTRTVERLAPEPMFDEVPERSVERVGVRSSALLPTDLCARCQFPRSDHKVETEPRHIHFRTHPGDSEPFMFPTTCREPYCHIVLNSCMGFVESGEIPVSSFSREWIGKNGWYAQ